VVDGALAIVRRLLEAPTPDESRLVDALFRAEASVSADRLRDGLGSGALDALVATGLISERPAGFIGTARMTRFGGHLIASDRIGFRNRADFVLAPGPATSSLAGVVRPPDGGRALDLGCGPGSLALWLAGCGADVLGIDISERALAFANFNRRLNDEHRVEFQAGDFLTSAPDPSLDGQFDVSVANPPFVLAPASGLVYRDGPLPRDATTRVAIERVARSIAPGGRGYVIGSWVDDGRGRWDARPRAWLRGLGARAIVTRISSVAPQAYVRWWTRDLTAATRVETEDRWLRYLEEHRIGRITTGVVALGRPRRHTWRFGRGVSSIDGPRPTWRMIEQALSG
jgi:SAM-dependent methyltransferase